jgi:hypothetical protein
MKYLFHIVFVLCSLSELISAQEVLFNNELEFKDGVYMSIEDFKKNKPSISLSSIDASIDERFLSAQTIKIDFEDNLLMKNIWGICLNGKVYLRIMPYISDSISRREMKIISDNLFVKIQNTGSLCYLVLPIYTTMINPIFLGIAGSMASAKVNTTPTYSPLRISDDSQSKHFILSLKENTAYELTIGVLKLFVKDDAILLNEINSDKKAWKKLLYYVLKYNERNPYYIQP